MDDRFQEEPGYRGARCQSCDAPITDENDEAEVTVWSRVGYTFDKRTFDGCEHERKIQAMRNAVLFLQAEIAGHEADWDNHGCPEDALHELCDGFGFEFHPAGTLERVRADVRKALMGRAA